MSGPTGCFSPTLLTGKRALITGGGTGIGKAIAFELARAGADLLLAARRIEVLGEAAKEISAATGRNVETAVVDIRNLESVANLAKDVSERWGQMDILVNNAGGQFPQKARDFSPNGWRTIIDLNLNGYWNMTQAFGNQMLDGRGGTICQITMTIGRGNPGIAHSGAARAAITELARSLSYEWGPKVRINCIGPGSVVTAGFGDTYDEDVLKDIGETPIPHPGTIEDIANAVVFLTSAAGRFITGELLMVDGGVSRYGSNQALHPEAFPERGERGPDW
ncbi:MAG: SDR family oxidoreductase [Pseudomonadota bacterium]